jgi:predicted  nucleic acid-binding Zn-ribbon protein
LDATRESYTAGLDEDLLDDYKRLFTTKNEAVVALQNEVCNGCHMKVTVSTVSAVKARKSVVHCEQCNRILYPE